MRGGWASEKEPSVQTFKQKYLQVLNKIKSKSQALVPPRAFTQDSINLQITCKVTDLTLRLRGVR